MHSLSVIHCPGCERDRSRIKQKGKERGKEKGKEEKERETMHIAHYPDNSI